MSELRIRGETVKRQIQIESDAVGRRIVCFVNKMNRVRFSGINLNSELNKKGDAKLYDFKGN